MIYLCLTIQLNIQSCQIVISFHFYLDNNRFETLKYVSLNLYGPHISIFNSRNSNI